MNQHALDRVEFGRVVLGLAAQAETEAGRLALMALAPDPHADTLAEAQDLYRRAAAAEALGRLTLTGAVDLRPFLDRTDKGAGLTALELYAIGVTIGRGRALATALDDAEDPVLQDHFRRFQAPVGLETAIAEAVTEDGRIKDSASPALRTIRRSIARLEAEIAEAFQRLLDGPEWQGYLQETLITLRNGRRVVPVKQQFRHNVPGLVHDQSGSGQTVFVEPMAVVERQNRIQGLRGDEREEIERILLELSSFVRQVAEPLGAMDRAIRRVDVLLAKVRWGAAHDALLPILGGEELVLTEARHPLLERPVPISLTVGGDKPVLIISGPNTGGKTAALKCAGLMVLLALSGCPLPASGETRVPLYEEVLADIGDEQNLAESLSTFAGHLRQLVPMVRTARPHVLLLIDEIGAGTDPEEGAALGLAILESVAASGAHTVVTTHFARLKLVAYQDPRVQNAEVEFDRSTLSPTYRLVMGQPGSSQALYMASRLGLDPAIVDRARALLGSEAVRVEEVIQELNRLEQDLRARDVRLQGWDQEVRAREAKLVRDLAHFEERRAVERQRDREKLREVERTLRARVERLMDEARAADRQARERALAELREEIRSWGLVDPEESPPRRERPAAGETARRAGQWMPGDWVTGPRLPTPGQLVEVDPKEGEALVAIGPLKMRLPLDTLQPAAPPPAPNTHQGGPPRSRTLPLECDLRGMTVSEAIMVLEQYLDGAVLAGMPMARIIHGKGTGALRRAVQDSLRDHPEVSGFRLGQSGEGGDGVTVVRFDQNA